MKKCVIEFNKPKPVIPAFKVDQPGKKQITSRPTINQEDLGFSKHAQNNFVERYKKQIEKNFENQGNKSYVFPRQAKVELNPEVDEGEHDSSIESMKGVVYYRLSKQNKKTEVQCLTTRTFTIFNQTKRDISRILTHSRHKSRTTNRTISPTFMDRSEISVLQTRRTIDKRLFFIQNRSFRLRNDARKTVRVAERATRFKTTASTNQNGNQQVE